MKLLLNYLYKLSGLSSVLLPGRKNKECVNSDFENEIQEIRLIFYIRSPQKEHCNYAGLILLLFHAIIKKKA